VAKAETNIPEQEEESSDDGGIVEEQVCNEGAPGWVVTFGDMMSLLLTFFILLLSFASMDQTQFKKLSGLVKEGLGMITRTNNQRIPKRDTIQSSNPNVQNNSRKKSSGDEIKKLVEKLQSDSTQDLAKTAVDVFQQYNDIKVSLPADDVFVPGTDIIQARIYPMLDLLATQARDIMTDKDLAIDVRIAKDSPCADQFVKSRDCDYWLLTSYQALSLSKYLQEQGKLSPARIVPVGRGIAPPNYVVEDKNEQKNLNQQASQGKPGEVIDRGQSKRGSVVEFNYVSTSQTLK
jgi:chemotaxis protein MotB